ncbi:imidazole glycerol phosphate synthase subunit HisH [Clostridium magnum]|uniref:Imidazole glycerol phosphate synthase subunit HisH n=1 Tax=Clostridium magnum DSM 2767 TaxID=1121326 RepID=A0A161X3L8_9CLOT|nr:imidazole glycerol phosphate synthase subunit HisH [Clostridium magnum]KZL94088.1 imidazole glycerol phosphate synthase subunit HisH 1 [Clostridium magnum DSM 2767]SHH95209.1 glutamine amidotransferase [Clostridium magnum DSM 2767]
MIAIIDYGMGNKYSVFNALKYLGIDCVITNKKEEIKKCDRIILPGVGAFGAAMEVLENSGLKQILDEEVIKEAKPFLGICLGMQLVAEHGYEKGHFKGLGWIKGEVIKLETNESNLKVPHVGWNDISIENSTPLLEGLSKEKAFYFVHSYVFKPEDKNEIIAVCNYGQVFTAALQKDNIFITQFHPEKSQKNGLAILENFSNWRG